MSISLQNEETLKIASQEAAAGEQRGAEERATRIYLFTSPLAAIALTFAYSF
jgi:hypothetical protein